MVCARRYQAGGGGTASSTVRPKQKSPCVCSPYRKNPKQNVNKIHACAPVPAHTAHVGKDQVKSNRMTENIIMDDQSAPLDGEAVHEWSGKYELLRIWASDRQARGCEADRQIHSADTQYTTA